MRCFLLPNLTQPHTTSQESSSQKRKRLAAERVQADLHSRTLAAALSIQALIPPATVDPCAFLMGVCSNGVRPGATADISSCRMDGALLIIVWTAPTPAVFKAFLAKLKKVPVVEAARKIDVATKAAEKKAAEKRVQQAATLDLLTSNREARMAVDKTKAAALVKERLSPGML